VSPQPAVTLSSTSMNYTVQQFTHSHSHSSSVIRLPVDQWVHSQQSLYPALPWTTVQQFTHTVAVQFIQFSLFNSSQRKSQWKASLKRWVLSPARNWLRLMDGEQRWSGSEFQITGAAMKKLRLPSLVVLARGTNRSSCLAEQRPWWPELSATVQTMLLK